MTPERLAEIRDHYHSWDGVTISMQTRVPELLAHIDELTRQLSDARDKAINAGIFTSSDGDESKYTHALNVEDCEGCGDRLSRNGGYCFKCETELSTPGATSYKP